MPLLVNGREDVEKFLSVTAKSPAASITAKFERALILFWFTIFEFDPARTMPAALVTILAPVKPSVALLTENTPPVSVVPEKLLNEPKEQVPEFTSSLPVTVLEPVTVRFALVARAAFEPERERDPIVTALVSEAPEGCPSRFRVTL